jgi:hypothetical protein
METRIKREKREVKCDHCPTIVERINISGGVSCFRCKEKRKKKASIIRMRKIK